MWRPDVINPGVEVNKLTVFNPVQFSFFLIHLENTKIPEKAVTNIFAGFVLMLSKVKYFCEKW